MSEGLSESFIERVNISLLQMLIRGYEPAPSSSLPAKLRAISPDGSTAMRDAVVQGTSLMIDLFKQINNLQMAGAWNFVHVILTDGGDNSSKVSVQQTKAVLRLIHDQLRGLNLKIIFIGVGVDSSTSYALKQLAASAGQNGFYYDINQNEIQNIFAKITVELGLQLRRDVIGIQSDQGAIFLQRDQIKRQIKVTQNNYAILFSLDISGSMAGSRWTAVCNSVQRFANNLTNTDFIAGIVFNTQAKLLLNEQLIANLRNQSNTYGDGRQPTAEQIAAARKKVKVCCGCCCFLILAIVLLVVFLTK